MRNEGLSGINRWAYLRESDTPCPDYEGPISMCRHLSSKIGALIGYTSNRGETWLCVTSEEQVFRVLLKY